MVSILSNLSALGASRQLSSTGLNLQQTLQRLTTGRRINSAADDAAGLGIGNRLRMDIKVATQGQRNANDGVSYLQTADGVLDEVTNLLTRASELAQQAKTGTISDSNRANIDAEFQNILKTAIDIGQNTKFNGASVFTSDALTVAAGGFSSIAVTVGTISTATSAFGLSQATTVSGTSGTPGALSSTDAAIDALFVVQYPGTTPMDVLVNAAQTWIQAHLNDSIPSAAYTNLCEAQMLDPSKAVDAVAHLDDWLASNPGDQEAQSLRLATLYAIAHPTDSMGTAAAAQGAGYVAPTSGGTLAGDNLLTASGASATASKLADALSSLSTTRAHLGASMQQLNAVSNSLGIQVQNFTAADSQIEDAHVADEVVRLTKFQILSQSGTSALGKSNQAAQQILSLLQ